jgi:hypothetical protein
MTIKVALQLQDGSILFKLVNISCDEKFPQNHYYGYLIEVIEYNNKFFLPCYSDEGYIKTICKTNPLPLYKEVTVTKAVDLDN